MLKAAALIVVVAFVVFYIMTSPDQAAKIADGSWHFVVHLAHGVGQFFDKLAS